MPSLCSGTAVGRSTRPLAGPESMRFFTAMILTLATIPIILSCWLVDPVGIAIVSFFSILLYALVLFVVFWLRSAGNPYAGLQGLVLAGLVLFVVSVVFTSWPMRFMFYLSRADFDRVAFNVQRGNMPTTPAKIGLFHIKKIESRDGMLRFWTNTSGDRDGFVHTDAAAARSQFSIWATEELSPDWQYIWED